MRKELADRLYQPPSGHAGPFGLSPLWGYTSGSRRSGVLGGHQGEPDARTGPPCQGPGVDGEGMDEVVLWALEEEGGTGISESEEEYGTGPPL